MDAQWDDEVVRRVAMQLAPWAFDVKSPNLDERGMQAAYLRKAAAVLDEVARILEERGLRVVPEEPTAVMLGWLAAPEQATVRSAKRWRAALDAAPTLRELLGAPTTQE